MSTLTIDWEAIECALHDWVTGLTDLDAEQVIWQDQNVPQPVYPYIAMKHDNLIRVSAVDEIRSTTDLTQPAGMEVALETVGIREFTLNVQAFVDEASGSNKPNCNAVYLLTALQLSLSQNSIREAFCLAGLAVVEELAVLDLSEVVNGVYQSRASMDIRFRTTFSCIERTGYIDKVTVESEPAPVSGPECVEGVELEVLGS